MSSLLTRRGKSAMTQVTIPQVTVYHNQLADGLCSPKQFIPPLNTNTEPMCKTPRIMTPQEKFFD